MIEVRWYINRAGKDVVGDWMADLDPSLQAKIDVRIARITFGNFGDCKPLREGVSEL